MTLIDVLDDPVALTAALVDIPSESGDERVVADAVEEALRHCATTAAHEGIEIEVVRDGDRVLARTHRNLPTRVVLAGHLDTVPIADNVPSRRGPAPEGRPDVGDDALHGCGTTDMKSGDAVILHSFAQLAAAPHLAHDLTVVFYDCEEVAAERNGLSFLERSHREWLEGDVAILGEPTGGLVEAGCQGTLRLRVMTHGTRAHSARAWLGDNAIHRLASVLQALERYEARVVDIDGCEYIEGLNAVRMSAGVAGNTLPDEASVEINFRFAPDRSPEQAVCFVLDTLGLPAAEEGSDPALGRARGGARDDDGHGVTWELTDMSPGALPGLAQPAAAALVAAVGGRVRAKYGWTDVSRFSALGIPAVNLGPGDPGMAHKRDEYCPVAQITEVAGLVRDYLTGKAH